jgi:hypothetical protein
MAARPELLTPIEEPEAVAVGRR